MVLKLESDLTLKLNYDKYKYFSREKGLYRHKIITEVTSWKKMI